MRRVCDSCKVSHPVSKTDLVKYGDLVTKIFGDKSQTFYKGKGCPACSNTGFSGRIGAFEFIKVTPELQDLISKNPSTKEVETLVKSQGFKTMFLDGIEKVKMGLTTLDELLRVIPPEK